MLTAIVDSFTSTLELHSELTLKSLLITFLYVADTVFLSSLHPALHARSNPPPDLWSTVWKGLLPSVLLGSAPFPGAVLSRDSSFILSKAFVAHRKLADAGAIKPEVLDQYKHPSLSPGLSEPHNGQLTKQCFTYVSLWKEWTSGASLLSGLHLFYCERTWK